MGGDDDLAFLVMLLDQVEERLRGNENVVVVQAGNGVIDKEMVTTARQPNPRLRKAPERSTRRISALRLLKF